MLAAKKRIGMAREDEKNKPADTHVKLRELFDKGRRIVAAAHSAKLERLKGKIELLTSNLQKNSLNF